ncbi:hypothetical protein EDB84DRAFT_1442190 [Lactarius hengduanensis]|nr:hypothetical protein EDB84DRAFT_1442190 [Lactarius hengduanensis]
MWALVRSGSPHGHRNDSGGSAGLKWVAFELMKAWSTAAWKAAEVVRLEKRALFVFFPLSSLSHSVAASQRGWLSPSGGLAFCLVRSFWKAADCMHLTPPGGVHWHASVALRGYPSPTFQDKRSVQNGEQGTKNKTQNTSTCGDRSISPTP